MPGASSPRVQFIIGFKMEKEKVECANMYKKIKLPFQICRLQQIWKLQESLQKEMEERGNADYTTETGKMEEITKQWRNLTIEFGEMMQSLPYKEWKNNDREYKDFTPEEKLEVEFEYVDMFHFFINIGIALGLDYHKVYELYVAKNRENFDRQHRGY